MSGNRNRGGRRERHERAIETHDGAAHAHMVASVAHERQGHLTAHESSRHALEQSLRAHSHTSEVTGEFGYSEIASAAHVLWEERGRPAGSAERDWFDALRELRDEHVVQVFHGTGGVRKNV